MVIHYSYFSDSDDEIGLNLLMISSCYIFNHRRIVFSQQAKISVMNFINKLQYLFDSWKHQQINRSSDHLNGESLIDSIYWFYKSAFQVERLLLMWTHQNDMLYSQQQIKIMIMIKTLIIWLFDFNLISLLLRNRLLILCEYLQKNLLDLWIF